MTIVTSEAQLIVNPAAFRFVLWNDSLRINSRAALNLDPME
jgi:hypothetical protein